jgi:AcrR family transcriptional regulator
MATVKNNNRRSTEVRRVQILLAARSIVVKFGSENVTIRKIADEVGITEGAIYRHFKSKRELLSSLADYAIENLLGKNKEAKLLSRRGETMDTLMQKHISDIEQERGSSFQVIAEIISFGDKKLNQKIYRGTNLYIKRLKDMVAVDMKLKKTESCDCEAAAIMLFGMIQGLVNIWALSNYKINLQKTYSRLWDIYSKAIT